MIWLQYGFHLPAYKWTSDRDYWKRPKRICLRMDWSLIDYKILVIVQSSLGYSSSTQEGQMECAWI
jgi:hypothetical protein